MKITKRPFGTLADGRAVTCYTMTSDAGCVAEILDYGAVIRALWVPDRNGNLVDVELGYDTLEEYIARDTFFGATVGRFANRIANGRFTLNGVEYQLPINDKCNHIHGGIVGFDKKLWAVEETAQGLVLSLESPDGEEGYPGNLTVKVTMSWYDEKTLELRYWAVTDKDTIINMTNHSYFNLSGKGKILDHRLQMDAEYFTINDENCLPVGTVVPVAGTAMDFRTERAVGERVDSEEPCVKLSLGYDSNFILNSQKAAEIWSPDSGIQMTVFTDQPGVQIYSCNFLVPHTGKGGLYYDRRGGICFETQHYPDCINHPEWPSCILRTGDTYETFTRFAFSIHET